MRNGRPLQTPNKKMAMIVPFRNREAHLQVFSQYMHSYLKDYITFRMFVIEQVEKQPFNRAMLMNIGYDLSKDDYDYFCFHDVDLLPSEPTNDYTYPSDGPRHLTVNLQNFKWTTPSRTILGGITCATKEHLLMMNGWSNDFWGWGAEDEDAYRRASSLRHILRHTASLTHALRSQAPRMRAYRCSTPIGLFIGSYRTSTGGTSGTIGSTSTICARWRGYCFARTVRSID